MANAVIDWAAMARDRVDGTPGVEEAMLRQCEDSVVRRAKAVLDGSNDRTGTAEQDQKEGHEPKFVERR